MQVYTPWHSKHLPGQKASAVSSVLAFNMSEILLCVWPVQMDQCLLQGNTVTDEGGAMSLQYGALTMTVRGQRACA